MSYKLIFLLLVLFFHKTNTVFAQCWDNPENDMLSNTMNDFFYYANDPVPFSSPNSLRAAEYNAIISDRYNDELDNAREYARKQQLIQQMIMQQKYNDYQYRRYRGFRY